MMKKGVITVYFSLIFMLLLSFLLALLETDRLYVMKTEGERYADMAAEMVFAGYIQPLADNYHLFGVYHGDGGSQLDKFDAYLKLNLEESAENKRLFRLYGTADETEAFVSAYFKDDNWKSLMEQVKVYEELSAIQQGKDALSQVLSGFSGTDADETVRDYCGQLTVQGERLEEAREEAEKGENGQEQVKETEDTGKTAEDPRKGISRWLKSGLLKLVMGNQKVSDRKISTSGCSWQTLEEKKKSVLTGFDEYREVAASVKNQTLMSQVESALKNQGDKMILNMYISELFKSLKNSSGTDGKPKDTALQYEIEYIVFGHQTDKENLESAVTACFTMRTILNLAYLYLSPDKSADLQTVVNGLTAAEMIPIAGEVMKLLLMVCWASAEAVVDCAGLAEGGKVPLMKDRNSWNMSLNQLLHVASDGGKASDYFKSGDKGLDYDQYLLLMLLLTPTEKKIIRMTQLIENNIWLVSGYENFKLKNCAAGADFSGTIGVESYFWQYPKRIQYHFHTEYSY